MSNARIIDGKAAGKDLRETARLQVLALQAKHNLTPALVVVLVGDDPASAIYVGGKEKAAAAAGIAGKTIRLPASTTQAELLKLLDQLNKDKAVHGILVQLPVPKHINEADIIRAIDPAKDVDGLHIENIGRLVTGLPGPVPCTPMGCITLLKGTGRALAGLHAVVIGRSNLVGKPVAQLLLRENCTVTMCHSQTKDLAHHVRQADIIVAAVGRPRIVKGDWIKPGAIVLDVGVNRLEDGTIAGDVDFDAALKVADFVTPVPGGVGPMTIAGLLSNTIRAACRQNGLDSPE